MINNGWVSVEERLPDIYENVLIYGKEAESFDEGEYHVTLGRIVDKGWINCDCQWFEATHWQPFPPAPPEVRE